MGEVTIWLDDGPCDWITERGERGIDGRCELFADQWVNLGRYCPDHYDLAVQAQEGER